MFVCACVRAFVCVCVCHVCIYPCMYLWMYVDICMHACMHACMNVRFIHICMSACKYVYSVYGNNNIIRVHARTRMSKPLTPTLTHLFRGFEEAKDIQALFLFLFALCACLRGHVCARRGTRARAQRHARPLAGMCGIGTERTSVLRPQRRWVANCPAVPPSWPCTCTHKGARACAQCVFLHACLHVCA